MYTYQSEVGVGGKYRDTQTGITGFVVLLEFHQHACERAILEVVDGTEIKSYVFDAARLEELEPPKRKKPEAPPEVHEAPPTGGGTTSPVRNRVGRR